MLGKIISYPDFTNDLKIEAINLCIALVLGGNLKAQDEFHTYFSEYDYKNLFLLNLS